MESLKSKMEFLVDCERINNFLERNQLIQAHGIAQRLENSFLEFCVKETPKDVENHPLWAARRAAYFVKNETLGGNTKKAVEENVVLTNIIRKISA